jgi:hypothetical protein
MARPTPEAVQGLEEAVTTRVQELAEPAVRARKAEAEARGATLLQEVLLMAGRAATLRAPRVTRPREEAVAR